MFRNTAKVVLSVVIAALLGNTAAGQAGCYFGVCPGDVGTEFPEQPTARIPLPVPQTPPSSGPFPQQVPEAASFPTNIPGMNKARLDELCRTAYYVEGNFVWRPPMGTVNALAVCEAALRIWPDEPELRFAYAVSRDMNAEQLGSPADNFYALNVYRELAAEGHVLAGYALGTMHDEDAGVSDAEALALFAAYQEQSTSHERDCHVIDEQAFSPQLSAGLTLTDLLMKLEQGSQNSYVCSLSVTKNFLNSLPRYIFSIPYEAHVKAGAVRGDLLSMRELGFLYANGSNYPWAESYKPHVTLAKDPERGGYWFLLAYYLSQYNYGTRFQESLWGRGFFADSNDSSAVQTALRALGFYNGRIDGAFGAQSRAALDAFVNSNMPDQLFQRMRTSETLHPTLPPIQQGLHIGSAALFQ